MGSTIYEGSGMPRKRAILPEQREDWMTGKRYMNQESLDDQQSGGKKSRQN